MTRLNDVPVFVIGDVHGHVDRLEALLLKAGCKDKECKVVQLGDLGHFGDSGSPTGDAMCWQHAKDGWIDYVLWGNHDRAVVDRRHEFGGYATPRPEIKHMMRLMEAEGRLFFAIEAHGWLLTHAGLHAQFKFQNNCPIDKMNVGEISDWLNQFNLDGEGVTLSIDDHNSRDGVVNAIGGTRGGWSSYGGILWRDITEKLYGIPQVFGHSASRKHKIRGEKDLWWCVDIGGKGGKDDPDAECLAGIWLPSQEIVRVDMNKEEDHQILSTTWGASTED